MKYNAFLQGKRIVIMAGGSGGHIFPALALADALSLNGAVVTWLGSKDKMEKRIIEGKYPIDYIKSNGIRNKNLISKISVLLSLTKSIFSAHKIIRKRKSIAIIGFGGYSSFSGGAASLFLSAPLFIHEQNSVMGLTNRITSKFAKKIFLGFDIAKLNKNKKVLITGNPVREEIVNVGKNVRNFYTENLNILVLGGSQGAYIFNQILPQIISTLPLCAKINIWHQCGNKDIELVKSKYKESILNKNIKVTVEPFIENMQKAYSWAQLVICRSGALTVSEIIASSLPAIFIPFPYATDNHQKHNCKILVKNNAATCIDQKDFTPENLSKIITDFYHNRNKLNDMHALIKKHSQDNVVDKIIQNIVNNI